MMETRVLPRDYTVLAPDGSEIRELVAVEGGSYGALHAASRRDFLCRNAQDR